MENTAFKNENALDTWCDGLSRKIISNNYLSRDDVALMIKTHIKTNEGLFFQSILSELDWNILIQSKKTKISFGGPEYIRNGIVLGELKEKRKSLNRAINASNHALADKRNLYKELKTFLWDTGHKDLVNEFMHDKDLTDL